MASCDISAIPATVENARKLAASGKPRSAHWRREQLQRLLRLCKENREEICKAVHADLKSPLEFINLVEVGRTIQEVNLALQSLDEWMKPEPKNVPLAARPAKAWIHKEPYGTVLIISPWNYPFSLLTLPLVGAFAAGNTAVVKPSEVSPHTAAVIKRLFDKYFEPDVVATVLGGPEVSQALLQEKFDYIMYTGNTEVGKIVMQAAAKHLTPVTLELGGKSPVYVDKSANLDVAARRILAFKGFNCGQTCIAPDYVLAHASIKDALITKMKSNLQAFYGPDPSQSTSLSRIISTRHATRIAKMLDESKDAIVQGGRYDVDKQYIEPTLLVQPSPSSRVLQEEIFGPLLPILSVSSPDEAIRIITEKDKPLALYIFASDDKVVHHVINNTSSGGVCVNSAMLHITCPEMEFGGVGPSGMGAYNGRHTFDTFTHRRAVLKKAVWPDPPVLYPPYTKDKLAMMNRVADGVNLPVKAIVAAGTAVAGAVAYGIYSRL